MCSQRLPGLCTICAGGVAVGDHFRGACHLCCHLHLCHCQGLQQRWSWRGTRGCQSHHGHICQHSCHGVQGTVSVCICVSHVSVIWIITMPRSHDMCCYLT